MRFITGLIVGVILTVGFAYIVDSMHSAPRPNGVEARRMVNWDVVDADMRGLSTTVQDAWTNLVGRTKNADKPAG